MESTYIDTTTSYPVGPATIKRRPATATVVIKPRPSEYGKVIQLSQIDQIAPRDYISSLLFFRLSRDADIHRVFRALELGLFETVKQIPQLTTAIARSENDREELELRYDASQGATLVMKDYTAAELKGQWPSGSFDDLEQQHFPLGKLPRRLVYGLSTTPKSALLPSLVVQASFIDGGLILGSCFHHTVGDGKCVYLYTETLARNTAAVSGGLPKSPFSSVIPIEFLERTRVVGEETGVSLEEFPDWKLASSNVESEQPSDPATTPRADYATYFISQKSINLLKDRFRSPDGFRPRGTEALGAFIWRHIVMARDIDPKRYPEAKLSMTVDTRLRMDEPKIPGTYWGNLAEPNAVARMPVAVLCSNGWRNDSPMEDNEVTRRLSGLDLSSLDLASSAPSSPTHHGLDTFHHILPLAARRIRASVAAVDNKAVRRLASLLKQMSTATTLTWNVDRWPGPDMLIVYTQQLRFNDLDFGPILGGCSQALRFTVGDNEGKPDGRCIILPPRRSDAGGLEVSVQYDVRTLERLRQNKEWTSYFEWRN